MSDSLSQRLDMADTRARLAAEQAAPQPAGRKQRPNPPGPRSCRSASARWPTPPSNAITRYADYR